MNSQRDAPWEPLRVDDTRVEPAPPASEVTSDGFGDRLLAFDAQGAPAWEWLRLRSDFAETPGVGVALARRAELIEELDHPSLLPVRVVEDTAQRGSILLRSPYIQGRRLSELQRARSAAFAMLLIRDLTLAVAALQSQGDTVSHGSLTMDRILVTTGGGLIIRDHVLGAALDRMVLTPWQMWSELGVLQPPHHHVPARQLDVIHIAAVALGCLLGRPLALNDYPNRVPDLIDRHVLLDPLRRWLDLAFALDGQGLASAAQAEEALFELFPPILPAEAETRTSLAIFGRKHVEPPPPPALGASLGFRHLLQDQGGTVFVLGSEASPIRHAHGIGLAQVTPPAGDGWLR